MCTAHTDLFINCKYSLDRWMRDICAGKNCHSISDCDTVVTAESGVLCPNQIAIYKKGLTDHSQNRDRCRLSFSNHVQMSLDDDRITVFISGSTRFLMITLFISSWIYSRLCAFANSTQKSLIFFCVEGTSWYHT